MNSQSAYKCDAGVKLVDYERHSLMNIDSGW